MNEVKPVIKSQNPEYKETLKQDKINKISILEDFVTSQEFKDYSIILTQAIHRITGEILNDMTESQLNPIHSLKEVKILLRKELVKLRDNPLATLKVLSYNIDKLGSTQ